MGSIAIDKVFSVLFFERSPGEIFLCNMVIMTNVVAF